MSHCVGMQNGLPNSEDTYNILDSTEYISLDDPDLQIMKNDRYNRNRDLMNNVCSSIAEKILPKECSNLSTKEKAAICIQKYIRGYQGRKKYVELLYNLFEKEETMRLDKIKKQVEEGQLLVDNHKLEVQLDDDNTTRKNRTRHYVSSVVTIQRQWRNYLKRKEDKCDDFTDPEEYSDTESAIEIQSCSLGSTPEANMQDVTIHNTDLKCIEATTDPRHLVPKRDNECDSVLSDYSEVGLPLRDFEGQIEIIQAADLRHDLPFLPIANCISLDSENIKRLPDETDEDYTKRVRKINLLSLAQEFDELKKQNVDALPLDLLRTQGLFQDRGNSDSADFLPSSVIMSSKVKENPHMSRSLDNEILCQNYDSLKSDVNSNKIGRKDVRMKNQQFQSQKREPRFSSPSQRNHRGHVEEGKRRMEDSGENLDFDVYNVETAVPQMDWDTLEQHLQNAVEEEERKRQAKRNDREEIRKRLAMGTDEESVSDARKHVIASRTQGGKDLQVCFMNETPAEDSEKFSEPVQQEQEIQKVEEEVEKEDKMEKEQCCNELNNGNKGHFFSKQEKLKQEAKYALAQASSMAHMQLEIEKQTKKRSPIADIVGIPAFGKGRVRLTRSVLKEMNIAQLQVLVNDIHTQIENSNRELVQLLIMRDDLHMEQDSMLVDIEDMSRRSRERAERERLQV